MDLEEIRARWARKHDTQAEWKRFCQRLDDSGVYELRALLLHSYIARGVKWALGAK